jgi:hypothetical protein
MAKYRFLGEGAEGAADIPPPAGLPTPGTPLSSLGAAIQAAEAYVTFLSALTPSEGPVEWGGWIVQIGERFSFTDPFTSKATSWIHLGALAQHAWDIPGARPLLPFHSHPSSGSFSLQDYLTLGPNPYYGSGPKDKPTLEDMVNAFAPPGATFRAGGQLVFGLDGSIRFVGRAGSGSQWIYNLRGPGSGPVSTGGVVPGSVTSGSSDQPPETSGSHSGPDAPETGKPDTGIGGRRGNAGELGGTAVAPDAPTGREGSGGGAAQTGAAAGRVLFGQDDTAQEQQRKDADARAEEERRRQEEERRNRERQDRHDSPKAGNSSINTYHPIQTGRDESDRGGTGQPPEDVFLLASPDEKFFMSFGRERDATPPMVPGGHGPTDVWSPFGRGSGSSGPPEGGSQGYKDQEIVEAQQGGKHPGGRPPGGPRGPVFYIDDSYTQRLGGEGLKNIYYTQKVASRVNVGRLLRNRTKLRGT